uniref:ABC transmembrane type-1 domain-containing protein n=1 Tax=Caenorhabditis tropicalis TaxID=1561998 RepID=A0A1I7T4R4_9PELO
MKAYESAGSTAEEVVSGIKIVQTFNGEQKEIDRYSTCLSEGMYWGIRRAFVSTFFSAFMSFATFSSMALAFWYGTSMVIDGLITPGTTFAVFWAVSGSMVCLNHASPQISVITTCRSAAAPIFKIIDRIVPFDGTSDDGITLSNVKGSVKFENVSFKYPTRPEVNVLENVNLYANQGENIAIVGHSGCGKSTLAALLMHFYEINDGKISVDGINIEELNLSHLRNLVGIVSQEPSLFVDTVEAPSILILDEATSALDTESESLVQMALENTKEGRTTITIAHRLSTIRNCNRIYVLDNGRVVEEGNHDQLMRKNGFYTQMIRTQESEHIQNSIQEESSFFQEVRLPILNHPGRKTTEESQDHLLLHQKNFFLILLVYRKKKKKGMIMNQTFWRFFDTQNLNGFFFRFPL